MTFFTDLDNVITPCHWPKIPMKPIRTLFFGSSSLISPGSIWGLNWARSTPFGFIIIFPGEMPFKTNVFFNSLETTDILHAPLRFISSAIFVNRLGRAFRQFFDIQTELLLNSRTSGILRYRDRRTALKLFTGFLI